MKYVLRVWRWMRMRMSFRLRGIVLWMLTAMNSTDRSSFNIPHLHEKELTQQVYVWQRNWSPSVQAAIHSNTSDFNRIVVLGAEVSFDNNNSIIHRVHLHRETLQSFHGGIGVAIRIGPPPGAITELASIITELAREQIRFAKTFDMQWSELQIDFDCPSSKLHEYRDLIENIRQNIAIPITITALPSWMNHPSFASLVEIVDDFVLQVHALRRPENAHSIPSLCDPEVALQAVQKANTYGKNFRVALPTYGYQIVFDQNDRFANLVAEEPGIYLNEKNQVTELWANPSQMSALVRIWTTEIPNYLTAIIWYRLPTSADEMNWSESTFFAVRHGQKLIENAHTAIHYPEPELAEIDIVNDGNIDIRKNFTIRVESSTSEIVTSDALTSFTETCDSPDACGKTTLTFTSKQLVSIAPGEHLTVGWLRLNHAAKVTASVEF